MPSPFLNATDVLQGNTYMDFINYSAIQDNNKEFIRNDMWEIKFLAYPACVYYPGDKFINIRCNSFNPGMSNDIAGIQQVIRGFEINQKTSVKTNGTLSAEFIDREDQAITIFFDDWKNKIMDPNIRYSFRKEDTIAKIKYLMFNTSRVPIRELIFWTCQPKNNGDIKEEGGYDQDVTQNLGVLNMSLDYEHSERKYLNLVSTGG
jgi:hypothetical protein